jgi:alpha-D-xyloside xylohydrolase
VSLQFDSSKYKSFESLSLQSSTSASIVFSTDDGVSLLVEASAPGVFRMRFGQSKLADPGALARDEAVGEAVLDTIDGGWRIVQGEDVLTVLARPLRIELSRKGETVLASAAGAKALAFGASKGSSKQTMAAWDLPDGAAVYGLGERFDALNRRGERSAGPSTDRGPQAALKNVPFCWSPDGWGLFVHTTAEVAHAVGAGEVSAGRYVVEVAEDCLDLYFFVGDPSDILNHYTQLTGRAALPPVWSLGLWLVHPLSEAGEVLDTARAWRDRGMPCDVMALQGGPAWEVKQRFTFDWNRLRLADAKRVVSGLKTRHFKVGVTEYPHVAASNPMFRELADKGWLLKDAAGEPALFTWNEAPPSLEDEDLHGPQPAGFIDFTHPEAYAAWRDKHRSLFDDGVDFMHTALGELPPAAARGRSGETGETLQRGYPALYERCVFEATQAHRPGSEPMILTRDGGVGAQRYPLQWQGETQGDWDSLAASIRAALSWGMSGAACSVHDLGAMSGGAPVDPVLYVRWLAQSVFSSHFRLPTVPGFEPWALGEEAEKHVRTWLHFRYRLIPYVMGAIEDAQRTGLPVMRAMPLAFPKDPEAFSYETQYLLGPALLVAPIVSADGKAVVYFPRGEAWWDLNTGWRYEGGTTWTFELGLDKLPVFGREGHMLCLGPAALHTGEFNSAKILDEVWMFGMPLHNPCAMRNRIRVMQMQGSSYAKGLEGLKILPSEGLEIKRRGAEVRISRKR